MSFPERVSSVPSEPPKPTTTIDTANTCWLFVSSSTEARHLHDIIFAVNALRKRGTPEKNILVFVDHSAPQLHFGPFDISNVFSLSAFSVELTKMTGYEVAVVTVTGHGHVTGLGEVGPPALTPTALVAAVRSMPGLQTGIVLLCQCFAGVFNLADARATPPLVLMGATNLNPSVSLTLSLQNPIRKSDGEVGLTTWGANIFMFCFFQWLSAPTDVDGDGKVTIMDAYKYAGAASNEQLRKAKGGAYMDARRRSASFETAQQENRPKVELDAHLAGLQQTLETLHLPIRRRGCCTPTWPGE
jgi:hypothetical protein